MGMDRKIERKWWSRRRIVSVAVAGPVMVVLLYLALSTDGLSRLNVPAERVSIATVTSGPFQVYISVPGTVLPIRTVYLDAVEGGRVDAIVREAGSVVKEGDTIVRLSNTNLLLDVMSREAQLFEQQNNLRNTWLAVERDALALERQIVSLDADLREARRTAERNEELAAEGVISRDEHERSRDRLESLTRERALAARAQEQGASFARQQVSMLESSIARIESNLAVVRKNLEMLDVRAPLSGTLTALHAEPGQSIPRGERLGQIDVLDGFKIRVAVDEHYLPRLELGLKGSFDLAGGTYRVAVAKIYPEVVDNRFNVDLHFEGPFPADVRRGQTVNIRLELEGASESVLVPRGAFYQTTGGRWILVLDPSGRQATRRPIRVGRQNPTMLEVLEGLEPGDRVITSSYETFGDAEKIVVQD